MSSDIIIYSNIKNVPLPPLWQGRLIPRAKKNW